MTLKLRVNDELSGKRVNQSWFTSNFRDSVEFCLFVVVVLFLFCFSSSFRFSVVVFCVSVICVVQ